MDLGESQELIVNTPEELTRDESMNLSAPKPVPNGVEEDGKKKIVPENKLAVDNLEEEFWLIKTASVFFL